MSSRLTPIYVAHVITTAPHKALRILLPHGISVNLPVAIFVVVSPEIAVPVDF
jgi:hypothetical protein